MENKTRIDFQQIEWSENHPGFRSKIVDLGLSRLRLIEIDDRFEEDGWCSQRHTGYILEGTLFIRFADKTIRYVAGDGLYIESGPDYRHQAYVAAGETARLLLFD